MWRRFGALMRTMSRQHPVMFSSVTTCVKTVAADLVVQKVVENREDIDWRRCGVFACFGFIYMGLGQYVIYVSVLSRVFPRAGSFAALPFREKLKDWTGFKHLLGQVFADNFVYTPFFFFPIFYWTSEMFLQESEDRPANNRSVIEAALTNYGRNAVEDNVVGWKIWIPVDLVLFSIVPLHLRLPAMAVVSFAYTMILSFMRGDEATAEARELHAAPVDAVLAAIALRERELSKKEFVEMLHEVGITDEVVTTSLFGMLSDSDVVTAADVATFLLAVSGSGSATHRAALMFKAFDLEDDGTLTLEEASTMIRALLRARERLAVRNTASARGTSEPGRLRVLRDRHRRYRGAKTIQEVLEREQAHLAESLMAGRKNVTRAQFEEWIQKDKEAARTIVALFSVFEPRRFL